MGIDLGALAADFSLGAVPVTSISLGAVQIWPVGGAVPDALDTGDWGIDAVAVGPTLAEVVVSIPSANATAVRWWNGVGSPWNSAENIGGGNWRLLDASGNLFTVTDGTHSGFKISYQQEGTDWSLESVDTKSVTFTESVVTPTEATLTRNIVAGYPDTLDLVASGVFVGDWPMEFRTTAGANIAHLITGNRITWHPAHDATAETVATTISAYWQGDMPVVALPVSPTNTAPPVITGSPGGALTAGGDTWSAAYIQRDYTWTANGEVVGVGPSFDSAGYEAMDIRVEAKVWVQDGTNTYVWNVSATATSASAVPLRFDSTLITFDSTTRTFDEAAA